MASRPRPPGAPPSTTSSTPSRPKPTSAPPSQQASSGGVLALDDNTDLISLGSFGSQHQSNENLNQEEAQTANLAALQGASEALRDAQLEKAAAEAKSKIQILTKDEEGRVISDTVLAMVDKSTEEMTAHEMDLFIQTLPIEELFKTFDLDGSGAIDFEEFSKMLPKIGIHIPEAQALKFFANCDDDGSGEIDQEEFCVCLIAATNASRTGTNNENHTVLTPLDAFQLFDEDGSDSIDFMEFNALCDYCGLSAIDEKTRKKKFQMFDEDGGGTLSFDEFKLTWILMTDPFQQAEAHGLKIGKFDTKAEVRERVMHYLEKLEENDEVSMIDAKRWIEYHHEKMHHEREARDALITSRQYWNDLPSDQWNVTLMIEVLQKLNFDSLGKKESLEHRIRSYVRDPLIFTEWMWELVESVLKMTDKGFESWGGVYTCGHGTNGQLGRPCDSRTSELSGAVIKRTFGETSMTNVKPPIEIGQLWEGPLLHLGEMGVDETTYNIASKMPERSPFEGPVDEEELNNIKKWREKQRPRFNSSQTFQGVESLASKGVNKIFSSFCSEIAFCHSTATGELWMMGGTKGSAGRDYAIPIEEPEIEKVSGTGAIYMKSKEVQEGLPFDTFNTPTVIDCFENQRIISMGLGRSHALGVLETSDLYCWGSNAHGQLGLIGSTRLNEGAMNPIRDTVIVKIPQRKGGSIVTAGNATNTIIGNDEMELADRDEDPIEAAQREEDFLRRPGGPILPNGSQTKGIDISRGVVLRHSGGGRTVVKDLGGRRTFFWDNESYLKEADQPMPVILDGIVGKGLQTSCVSCGPTHSVAIAAGRLYSWGAGPESNLGRSLSDRSHLSTPWSTHSPIPKLVELPRGLSRIPMFLVSAGASHTVAVSRDGRMFGWGNCDGGRRKINRIEEEEEEEDDYYSDEEDEEGSNRSNSQIGFGSSLLSSSLQSSTSNKSNTKSRNRSNSRNSLSRTSQRSGSLTSRSSSSSSSHRTNRTNRTNSTTTMPSYAQKIPAYVPRQIDVQGRKCYGVACGSWHTVCLLEVTSNDFPGALSRATSIVTASSMPGGRDPVAGDQPVGVVWAWGNGRFGQLGRGMKPNEQQFQEPRPVSILGGKSFGRYSNDGSAGILTRKICCGSNHSAALTAAGTLWTWGYNRHGCLGRPSRQPYFDPPPARAPGRDTTPTNITHSGVGSVENYSKLKILPENLKLVSGIPRMVKDLTGFPRGRILDIGCGADFTIVCTAPWTGIGPMQIKELNDCAVRVLQSLVRKFLSKLRAIRRKKKEFTKMWHLKKKKWYYLHNETGEKSFHRPACVGANDNGIRVVKNTQIIPSIQSHAEDTFQKGPMNQTAKTNGVKGYKGSFIDGTPGIPYSGTWNLGGHVDEHAVLLHDWNHTIPYRRTDPLRISLQDGRIDRSKWPENLPHEGRRNMSALPALQYCKPRKPFGIPLLKNGNDGTEEFLKEIMEPPCRLCKICRRMGGFRPSANNLFLCSTCHHHKSAHGRSKHPMTEKEAVKRIINVWRSYSANQMIIRLLKSIYEKHWHQERQAYYYFNKATKESKWTKPILLGDHDIEPLTEKPEETVAILQDTNLNEDEKLPLFTPSDYDTESDAEESMKKQTWLREEATAEERMEFSGLVAKRVKRRKQRLLKKQIKASIAIGNVWRSYRARQDVTALLRSIYEKIWNEKHSSFYWFNKATGVSTWTRPVMLGKIGDVTPRFEYD